MKRIISPFLAAAAFACTMACSNPIEDPAVTAKSFYEALAAKDFDKASQLATTDSKTLLELLKSMIELGTEFNTNSNDLEKMKTAVYTTESIEGDKATVKVKTGKEENFIRLLKEDGAWKVALDKESLQETIIEKSSESEVPR